MYYCKRCTELTYPVEDCVFCKMGRGESSTKANQGEEMPRTAKDLGIENVKQAKTLINDLKLFGDGDTWVLLCKASSRKENWMKSTKVMNVPGGCIVQVTTQQGDAVAEALTYVPGVQIVKDGNPPYLSHAITHAGGEVVQTSTVHSPATRSDHRR